MRSSSDIRRLTDGAQLSGRAATPRPDTQHCSWVVACERATRWPVSWSGWLGFTELPLTGSTLRADRAKKKHRLEVARYFRREPLIARPRPASVE